MKHPVKIRRALLSVSKKEGLVDFAKILHSLNIEILSTGGTADLLKKEGIPVVSVSDFTGSPEILEGRVKTLHPKIHGGLLGRRDSEKHQNEMKANHIEPIDLVVVNLYPFEETVSKQGCKLEEAIENIDIGGPSMIRSASKNYAHVTVLVDPADYRRVGQMLTENDGATDYDTRWYLAKKAFSCTAAYDGAISNYLTSLQESDLSEIPSRERFPEIYNLQVSRVSSLRYGENPHQAAAYYRVKGVSEPCAANAECLHGKELSFNNLLDLNACLEIVKEFKQTACVIVKHNNPCGVAIGADLREAFLYARACDPVSAFGGIVAVNRKVDRDFASEFNATFFEAVIAPDYDIDALELLKSKKNLRILKLPAAIDYEPETTEIKKIVGGLLLQDRDLAPFDIKKCKVVSERAPTADELAGLDFAWRVAKHVKSNAIVYTDHQRTLGIGAGQMSRVDSVRLGALKAQFPLQGSCLASDAFFPFRDGVDAAAKFGVSAIIQPGGSVRDEEVIQAANEHHLAMIFTGMRHFRH